MRLVYILYGFGILLCVSGIGLLAAEYIKFMSEAGKMASLVLSVGLFYSLGRYFESKGW
jgi:hypothetical protein